ncbi:MAG: FkbM family methyltransferase [Psychromonas sp.]|nr:FkbM family methyltransferase [Psychromonas sp.]
MTTNLNSINYHPGKFLRLWRKINWYFKVFFRPRHIATITTANGVLSFDSKDKKTGRIIYVYRHFEYDMMQKAVEFLHSINALKMPKGKGTVLDVGGYIGMSSTGFMLSNCFEKSIAFEPNPNSYKLLCSNITQNKLDHRVTVHNIALSDKEGELEFELSNDNYGDHRIRSSNKSSENKFNEGKRETINIKADSLDGLIEKSEILDIDNISLVWMDVQGHEGYFIKGASNFLKKHKNIPIIMEFWPYAMNRSGMNKSEFIALVSQLFNSFYSIDDKDGVKRSTNELMEYYEKLESSTDPSAGDSVILLNDT